MLFDLPLGQVVMTPGVAAIASDLDRAMELKSALRKHAQANWGDCCPEDRAANDDALRNGDRVMSVWYFEDGSPRTKFWIITEWDRSVTTVLLPEEY